MIWSIPERGCSFLQLPIFQILLALFLKRFPYWILSSLLIKELFQISIHRAHFINRIHRMIRSTDFSKTCHTHKSEKPQTGLSIRSTPARAGNTCRVPSTPPIPKDHPRSRGEYGFRGYGVEGCVGSPPLARGIRG